MIAVHLAAISDARMQVGLVLCTDVLSGVKPIRFPRGNAALSSAVIAATGLHTPAQSVSNVELVTAFNAYVELFNAEHAGAIAAGEVVALIPSSEAFIEKASGIKSR